MKRSLLAIVLTMCAALPCAAQRSTPIQLVQSAGATDDQFGTAIAISGDTLIVGAPKDDVGTNVDQGSAHVYRWTGSGWAFEATLIAADGAAADGFGNSIALSGDTAIVSAWYDDVGANANQGSAYIFVRTPGTTTWTQQAKLTTSGGAANDLFGFSVALSDDTAVVGAALDDVGINTNQGSACVFVRAPGGTAWTQQAQLIADDGGPSDVFGNVAIAGDTVIVGAPGDDVGANGDQGSAYVFIRSGTTWTQQAKLTATGGAANDTFGNCVALSGDTAIVGAYLDDVGANADQGSAYVFTRSGTTWTQQAQLTAAAGAANDNFANSVCFSGDTAIVGAYLTDVGANPDQGAAYVFVGSGSSWTQQAQLTVADGAVGDRFGFTAALWGDTAIVAAYLDDVGPNTDQGSAWVFSRVDSTWIGPDLKVVASDGAVSDNFGNCIAISGDTVIVGAPYDDVGANGDQGSAYVFVRAGSAWVQQAKLVASDGATQDLLGAAVAIVGDIAIIGAPYDDAAAVNQGSAYVFTRSGTTWTQQARLNASDGAYADHFGCSVAIDGDTAVVGAMYDDASAADQGSAYVFTNSGSTWTQQTRLLASDGAASDGFGYSVDISGDTIAVGAANDDVNYSDQGSAYIFVRTGTTWSQQARLSASDAAAADYFGTSIAVSNDTVVVGAYRHDVGANADQGAAYVFTRSGAVWSQQARLTATDGLTNDFAGYRVDTCGEMALVSAHNRTVSASLQGSAHLFTRSGDTWTQQATFIAPDGAAQDYFGYALSLSTGRAVITAFNDDIGVSIDQGSFYSFDVPYNDLLFAHNDATDVTYPTIAAALLPVVSGQQITASQAAFRTTTMLDTFGKSLGLFCTGDLRTPATAVLTLGGSSALVAPVGSNADIFGQLRVSGYADVYADAFLLGSRGVLTARTGSSLTINATLARLEGQTRLEQGASMTFTGGAQNIGPVTAALESDITAGATITNSDTYSITGATINTPLFFNRAAFNVFGTSAIFGSFTNNDGAITTIRSGSLYVFGSFTNNGTVVGTICAGCLSSPPSLDVGGDLVLGAQANLSMPFADALVHVAGDFDAALNNNTRYDMSVATLQFEGFGGEQTLEVMSTDIGPNVAGLDRTIAGHFPIGTLHIGPANATVRLVDRHDNDGMGQTSCEAIYVDTLRIDAGSRLINPECRIYYNTLVNEGTVDVPENLVQLAGACLADFNMDGFVDFTDFDAFVTAFEAGDPAADFNQDGFIDFTDFDSFVSAFEAGC